MYIPHRRNQQKYYFVWYIQVLCTHEWIGWDNSDWFGKLGKSWCLSTVDTRYDTPRIMFFPTDNDQCMIFTLVHYLASFGFHKPTKKLILRICFKSMFSLVKRFKEPTGIQNVIKINDHRPSFSCLILQRVELEDHKMRKDLPCCLKGKNNESFVKVF